MLRTKNNGLKNALKEYYRAYYNGYFMRDFRYIPDDKSRYNEVFNAKKLGLKGNAESRALHFLTKKTHQGHDGLIGGEITYYHSREEFLSGDITQRYSDRLFFDLDIEDLRVEMIKEQIKSAYATLKGKELDDRIQELKKDFRDLIFNSDLLRPTFEEAKKLCLYLEDMGLKPYLIFSGAKGFHCDLFYDEVRLQNLSQVSRLFAKSFSDRLSLKYLDWSVFDKKKAQRRLQRCQYIFHSKTDLLTVPIPDIYDYDEVLAVIKKNQRKPIPFNLEDYTKKSSEFRESLIHNDRQFQMMNERKARDKKKENEARIRERRKHGHFKDYQDISMTELFQHYGGEIIKEESSKAIVRCLFHGADRHPSAVIFKDSNYFHCSSCGKTLNYYGFISEMEGTDDHHQIMSKADEFLK